MSLATAVINLVSLNDFKPSKMHKKPKDYPNGLGFSSCALKANLGSLAGSILSTSSDR